ncbi:hypothetical protein ANN_02620 [Periplaneta americana]|uniref:Uncharacterized protein n=1 Tax=Periplaneta americana TaxID=6978 RepID=A0ABQ8TXZ4_PERAM|nr:hypothetical protein ANN_02620 [Periplaneta americana]
MKKATQRRTARIAFFENKVLRKIFGAKRKMKLQENEEKLQENKAELHALHSSRIRTLRNKTRKDTQIKLYKVMAIPTGLYASETWTLKEKDRSRLQAAEMRFLRSVVGVTRLDHIRNEEIRYNLKVNSLLETVDEYKQKWWEHVQRMSQDRTPKIIADYVPIGKRSIGRPAKRWIQEIKEPQRA